MDFTVQKIQKKDFYATFTKWCEAHKFPEVSDKVLPENCFVCFNGENQAVYSMWFYHTDSGMAHIGWPVSNKEVPFNKRDGGLDFLMNHIVKYGKRKNYSVLFTTTNTKEITNVLEKNGFVNGDMNVNQKYKIL